MSDSPQERCGLLNRHTSFLPPGKTASKTRERCAFWRGGAEGGRTPDLLIANEALSQLSYGPAKMQPRCGGCGVPAGARHLRPGVQGVKDWPARARPLPRFIACGACLRRLAPLHDGAHDPPRAIPVHARPL